VVPLYRYNPKPSFPKSYLKSKRLKGVLLKNKGCFGFKNLRSNTLSCFKTKRFQNPKKLCQNKPLFGVKKQNKTTLKKVSF
jgi:hypothetical protein